MGKTLITIGGSRLQVPGLRFAREAGLEVVLTDLDPDAPGRRLASRFEEVGGTDVDALVSLARELARGGRLAGAYCSNDFGLPAVAAIGETTGTPANAPSAVRLALDKAASTEAWRQHGVPTTTGRSLASITETPGALAEVGYPAIVKPATASGSRGVRTVQDEAEAHVAVAAAFGLSRSVLVERVLEGLHLDVNGFFRDGAFVPAGLLERFFTPPPHHVPLWGVQPAGLTPEQERAVYELVERAARTLEISTGPVKADVVWSASGPAILELAPRFHGDVSTAHVTPLAYGKSPIQAWLACLAGAGGPFDEMPAAPRCCAGWMALFPDRTGTLAEIEGLERARSVPGIAGALVHRPRGHAVASLSDNTAVCGFLWATGRDAKEVEERLREARALVEVKIEWRSAA